LRYSQDLIRFMFGFNKWLAIGKWRSARAGKETTWFRVETKPKRGFDRSVTVRSKWGGAFVFNRSDIGGWGKEIGASGNQEIGRLGGLGDRKNARVIGKARKWPHWRSKAADLGQDRKENWHETRRRLWKAIQYWTE
jgi:hypothetical protein